VDFSPVDLTEDQQAFADEVRSFLDENLTEEVYARRRARADNYDEELYLAVGAKGWLFPRWRKEDGGADLDDVRVKILQNELRRRDAPIGMLGTTNLVWPAVEAHGDPGLRAELKRQVARGAMRFSLGYTEPDGGSDIAAAKTRAVRDGDEWVINGQKIFTSRAQYATHIFLITRTDPSLPKHKGLTMFLVPTSSPGFERQPLPTIGDETTNVTFYSDIRLPDRYRIGEVNNGWSVLHGPLDAEHHLGGHVSKLEDVSGGVYHMFYLSNSVEAAVRWARDAQDGDGPLIDDHAFLAGIGHLLTEMEAGAVTPSAMGRVKGSDVARLGCEELIDLVGPAATLPYGAEGAISDGIIEFAHRQAQHTATPGGTVEVFRTIIAQHDLGLPRPDYPGRKVFLASDRPGATAA
jgi:alkylation response protein AidB-like acyl-CoA dehydrogenase